MTCSRTFAGTWCSCPSVLAALVEVQMRYMGRGFNGRRERIHMSYRLMARRRLLPAIVVVGLALAGAAAQQQRPRIPPTGTIKKVSDTLHVTVIEGHGDVNTWEGFRDYVRFNRALVDAAKAGMGQRTAEEIAAGLRPKFPVFTKEELLTDMDTAARRCRAR